MSISSKARARRHELLRAYTFDESSLTAARTQEYQDGLEYALSIMDGTDQLNENRPADVPMVAVADQTEGPEQGDGANIGEPPVLSEEEMAEVQRRIEISREQTADHLRNMPETDDPEINHARDAALDAVEGRGPTEEAIAAKFEEHHRQRIETARKEIAAKLDAMEGEEDADDSDLREKLAAAMNKD